MKTQTPIFPTVTASIHYIGRLSLATLLIYPSPYCASAMCLGQRAGSFFFSLSKPRVLGSWDFNPSSSWYIFFSPCSFLPFPSLAREFQYLRHVPWFYIFLLYQLPPSPLVQPMHSSSYTRPTISIIILFTKLLSCFLGVLVVTVLWFFSPTVSFWYLACRLFSSFIAAVYVIGGHSFLLPFLSSSAYTYSPLLRLSRLNRSLFTRTANHRDFP